MFDILERLCNLDSTSGDEISVREFIINEIKDYCDWKTDNLGNIIAFKKGKNKSAKKLMLDAHMDEVGLIITSVTADGFLKFKTVGGIDASALMFRSIKINDNINGVISGKPIHLISSDERKKPPKEDSLYIDIGAISKEDALKCVSLGSRAVLCGEYSENGEKIISKALDDRIGCAVLIKLIKEYDEYDFYASFSVQEEVGLRGAKVTAFAINPDSAIVLEGTTAADISGVSEENKVCKLGEGVAVSFMDTAAVYDKEYYDYALTSGIKCQPKAAVTGGNNSGVIHFNGEGVRTVALSLPCRYIHTSSSVADKDDCECLLSLAKYMLKGICSGKIS
ncbi:MAG: M42 family peptidase [Clostridia bacterium]|nr:M42 family peptidase [Clostridia bacterium]